MTLTKPISHLRFFQFKRYPFGGGEQVNKTGICILFVHITSIKIFGNMIFKKSYQNYPMKIIC